MNWSDMSHRERDALVAEKVMGWTPVLHFGERGTGFWDADGEHGSSDNIVTDDEVPAYTTDISAAWEVVEEMVGEIKGAPYAEIAIKPYLSEQVSGHKWCVKLDHVGPGPRMGDTDRFNRWWVSAPTASEAICLAALRAKGVEV